VIVLDNLSRGGVERNLAWLRQRHGDRVRFIQADVRHAEVMNLVVHQWKPKRIYHLAAQVAVTTSVDDPRTDFEVNALGSLNVLEAVRRFSPDSTVVLTSTNKVYGKLDHIPVREAAGRYELVGCDGVDESAPLDFHSPYGCSKGAADQYFRDYARIYGVNSVVFRMSCIYGTRQFGNEDQGWVAHFLISWHLGRAISIYGDGKQVRDVLWVDDLVEALDRAAQKINVTAGQVYNIGGGAGSAISIWHDFSRLAAPLFPDVPDVTFHPWRPGDQSLYVSDVSKAARDLGWAPQVTPDDGITRLAYWIRESDEFTRTPARTRAEAVVR
jgi:CDP-paratose 2-epimerase